MEANEYVHWAWMLRDMRQHAAATWRDEYAPAIEVDDLFANNLRRIRIVCDHYPQGYIHVGIKVQARSPGLSEWYWWKVRHMMGVYHIL